MKLMQEIITSRDDIHIVCLRWMNIGRQPVWLIWLLWMVNLWAALGAVVLKKGKKKWRKELRGRIFFSSSEHTEAWKLRQDKSPALATNLAKAERGQHWCVNLNNEKNAHFFCTKIILRISRSCIFVVASSVQSFKIAHCKRYYHSNLTNYGKIKY